VAKRTLKELRQEVYNLLGVEAGQFLRKEEIDKALNRAEEELVMDGDLVVKSATMSTVADQERYLLPTDLIKVVRVDYDGNKIDRGSIDDVSELDVT